jgi:hypothetical protein
MTTISPLLTVAIVSLVSLLLGSRTSMQQLHKHDSNEECNQQFSEAGDTHRITPLILKKSDD